ncbi:MAG: DUF4382 domain-containing protein [Cyclobacteriaceae bacterium]
MNFNLLKWSCLVTIGLSAIWFSACNEEDGPSQKGDVDFEITDAPIDDSSVKGVFVTIADVKVDGQSLSGFTKTTIDLKAYQEGNTKALGSAQLDAKTYSNILLVLDLDEDANGNEPGCYVLSEDGTKFKLKNTTTGTHELAVSDSWEVAGNTTNEIVMDFDLRKSIRYDENSAIQFQFVSDNELKSAVRVVSKANAGMIKGTYNENVSANADKVIVYAYKRGTFNANTETQGNILFANSVTSAEVKSGLTGNSYTLALLEEGEYELHFAAHSKNTSGKLTFDTMLASETKLNGSVKDFVEVTGGVTLNLSTSISGILN